MAAEKPASRFLRALIDAAAPAPDTCRWSLTLSRSLILSLSLIAVPAAAADSEAAD